MLENPDVLSLNLFGGQLRPATGVPVHEIPKAPNELERHVSRSYDLTASTAIRLDIPVCTLDGASERRVLVQEWAGFKCIEGDLKRIYLYGYAIRFCLTVSKWDGNAKASLGFIAASAELGQVQAQWVMQVKGLGGKKIQDAMVPPTNLNVETLVRAKDSFEKLAKAVFEPDISFLPVLIGIEDSPEYDRHKFQVAIASTCALTGLSKGWSLEKTLKELPNKSVQIRDMVVEAYREFADIRDPGQRPSAEIRRHANSILGGVTASKRSLFG